MPTSSAARAQIFRSLATHLIQLLGTLRRVHHVNLFSAGSYGRFIKGFKVMGIHIPQILERIVLLELLLHVCLRSSSRPPRIQRLPLEALHPLGTILAISRSPALLLQRSHVPLPRRPLILRSRDSHPHLPLHVHVLLHLPLKVLVC